MKIIFNNCPFFKKGEGVSKNITKETKSLMITLLKKGGKCDKEKEKKRKEKGKKKKNFFDKIYAGLCTNYFGNPFCFVF